MDSETTSNTENTNSENEEHVTKGYVYNPVDDIAEVLVDAANETDGVENMGTYLDDYFKQRDCEYPVDPFSSVSSLRLALETSYTLLKCDELDEDVRNVTVEALHTCM
jgi:hypothetical protein